MVVRVTVLLDDEVDARFTDFCQRQGFKKSTLAARLIREHLAREGRAELDNQQTGHSPGDRNGNRP